MAVNVNDIFDTKNVKDLPKDIINQLGKSPVVDRCINLLKLANRELSIDEITVAFYRLYTLKEKFPIKTKKQIMSILYIYVRNSTNPIIESVKGIYKLKKESK
jgi:hypothetical protein